MDDKDAIRTLIVDDEPPARARLRRLLGQIEDCELAGEAGSGSGALEMIPELNPDLVLLDISMPGMDGMALAATLQAMERPPAVVFCTAWPDQALEAFDHDAVDYLVKPVRLERLEVAVNKVRRIHGNPSGGDRGDTPFLRATVGGRTILVPLEDVCCLVAEDKYTTVHFRQGKTVVNDSLVDLERRFPSRFFRVHRNTLVASACIRGLEKSPGGRHHLLLDGTAFQPEVSRRQLSAVRRFIKEQV